MRSDFRNLDWFSGFGFGVLATNAAWAVVLLATGCASSLVPKGGPVPTRPCVGTYQADSAWVCAPRDTTGAR